MPGVENHLLHQARNHKSLFALVQDLHAPGMRARFNVEPCVQLGIYLHLWQIQKTQEIVEVQVSDK